MNMKFTRFRRPTEPGENHGGFRKVKRGEGAAQIRGSGNEEMDPVVSTVVSLIFGLLCLSVPVSFLLAQFWKVSWANGSFWGGLVLAHLVLIGAETITHREIPIRKWGMLSCWGTFLVWMVILAMS